MHSKKVLLKENNIQEEKKQVYSFEVKPLTEEEKKSFVLQCEEEFEVQLAEAANIIIAEKCRVVTLSGPTCSGKTTTASRFVSALRTAGRRVGVISIDDFFKSQKRLKKESVERGLDKVDYDSALAIDLDLFEKCIKDILAKKKTMLPKYSFVEGRCIGFYEFNSEEYDCIILEGIQAVYPEVTDLLPSDYKSVQISVVHDAEVNGSFFTSRQIRFLRRMIRDAKFRNAPPELTFQMWKGVSENEDLHILPFEGKYDIELDSFMEYELFMIHGMVEELLKSISPENEYHAKAEEIRNKLEGFFDISADYLPEISVYHEFLG